MVQRVRASLASRPNTLAVVAVVLFVAILILTGRWLNRGGGGRLPAASSAATGTAGTQAPARIGTRTKCPPRWPVLAASNHTSYPPGHPGKPPAGVTAVACYQTAIQAASAGYAPAPPPAGVLEVGGVYLVPTGPASGLTAGRSPTGSGSPCPAPGCCPSWRRASGHRGCASSYQAASAGSGCGSSGTGSRSRPATAAPPTTAPWTLSPTRPPATPASFYRRVRMRTRLPRSPCTRHERCWRPAPRKANSPAGAAGCCCAGPIGAS
jgi:hypothetical protein